MRSPLLCLLTGAVIAGAIAVVYAVPWHVSSLADLPHLLGLRDHWFYYAPSAFFLDSALQRGELPLWNPLVFTGTPYAANPNSFLFYPPHFLRALLTFDPSPLATHAGLVIGLALHLIIAGVGAFFFAREHRLGPGACLTAAFVFVFSAGFLRRTTANMFVTTAVWLPLLLLFYRRAFHARSVRSKLRFAAAASLVFGLALLAGSPHMSLLMSMTLAGYATLLRLLVRSPSDGRGRTVKGFATDACVGFAIVAVGAACAAAMLLPALEFAGLSERGSQTGVPAPGWRDPLWFLRLLVTYTGDPREGGLWLDYRLAGLGATALALAAFVHERRRDVAVFAILFAVLLDCSLGPPLPFATVSGWLSPIGLNDVSRAMMWACFPLAMLAAFGVDAVATRWHHGVRTLVYPGFFLVVGSGMLWLLWDGVHPHPYLQVSGLVVLFPALILALIALAGQAPRDPDRASQYPLGALVQWSLPLLVLLEITAWSWRFVPHLIDWGGYGGDVASLQHAAPLWSGNHRLPVEVPNTNLFTLAPAINGYDPLYVARAHHVLRSPPAYDPQLRLESVAVESHRGNLFLKRSLWLASQYVDGPLPAAGSLFPAATTVFLRDPPDHLPVKRVAAGALPASSVSKQARQTPLDPKTFQRRADAHSVSLTLPEIGCPRVHGALVMRYETDSRVRVETSFHSSDGLVALGKAFAVTPTNGSARRLEIPLPDLLRLRVRIDATSVDPSAKAPGFAITAAHVACDLADEDRRIRILFRGANSVRVELAGLPGPRILTFLDPHYPGWRARLDGEPVPILLANDAFKAVVVPAGEHEVEFVFRPTRVYAGMTISLVSTLAAVALVWRLRERTAHSP